MSMRDRFLVAVVPVLALGFVACGDDDGTAVRDGGSASGGSASGSASAAELECETVGDPSTAEATVEVDLKEYEVNASPASVASGVVAFEATISGDHPHELVVVKGAPDAMPLDADGALDEAELADGALVGEIEPFPAGETCAGAFELEAGDYTLLCNIVEDHEGEVEAHVAEGMIAPFTVE
jgi:hypothetical protein